MARLSDGKVKVLREERVVLENYRTSVIIRSGKVEEVCLRLDDVWHELGSLDELATLIVDAQQVLNAARAELRKGEA